MKIIENILNIIVVAGLCALSTNAEISFPEIKGTYSDIKVSKKYLSPVNGFNWWKTGIINNLYRYGNPEDATIKLLRELFYLQQDQITFDTTNLARKPAKYFTPRTIGKILNIIDKQTNETNLLSELKQVIKQDINLDSLQKFTTRIIEDTQLKLENLPAKKELTAKKVALNKQIVRIQKGLTKGIQSQKQKDEATEPLKKEIEELNRIIGNIEEIKRSIHNQSLSEKSVDELAILIVQSLKEIKEGKYISHTLEYILTSFVWKKSQSKAELWEYLDQFEPSILDQSISKKDFLEKRYTKKDYADFKQKINLNSKYIFDNYELSSFASCARKIWDSPFPPLLGSIGDAKYIDSEGRSHFFGDCGETTLRNFFNIILYDQGAGRFEIKYIEQDSNLSPSTDFKNFYTQYKTVEGSLNKSHYDSWAQIVSNLPGVRYVNQGYEIHQGLNNLLAIINHLVIKDKKAFKEKTNEEKLTFLCTHLSRPHFQLEWDLGDEEENPLELVNTKNNDIEIFFTINKKDSFSLQIFPDHFILDLSNTTNSPLDLEVSALLTKEIIKKPIFFYLFGWYADIKNILACLENLKKEKASLAIFTLWTCMYKLSDPYTKSAILKVLLFKKVISNSMLLRLGHSLPDDSYYWNDILEKFNNMEDEIFVKDFINSFIKSHPILPIIARHHLNNLYQFITPQNVAQLNSKNLLDFLSFALHDEKNTFQHYITQANINKLNTYDKSEFIVSIPYYPKFHHFITSALFEAMPRELKGEFINNVLDANAIEFYSYITSDNIELIDKYDLRDFLNNIIEKKLKQYYGYISQTNINKLDAYGMASLLSTIIDNNADNFNNFITPANIAKLKEDDDAIALFLSAILKNQRKDLYKYLPKDLNNLNRFALAHIVQTIVDNELSDFYHYITSDKIHTLEQFNLSQIMDSVVKHKIKTLYPIILTDETLPKDPNIINIIVNNQIEELYPIAKKFLSLLPDWLQQELSEKMKK